jgi:hypothetical protein
MLALEERAEAVLLLEVMAREARMEAAEVGGHLALLHSQTALAGALPSAAAGAVRARWIVFRERGLAAHPGLVAMVVLVRSTQITQLLVLHPAVVVAAQKQETPERAAMVA